MIGKHYKGVIGSDFWSAYNLDGVVQQKCHVHLKRELKEIAEEKNGRSQFHRFKKKLKRILNDGVRPHSAYNPAYAIWAAAYIDRNVLMPQLSSHYTSSGQPDSYCSRVQQWYILMAAYNSGNWYNVNCVIQRGTQGYAYVTSALSYYGSWSALSGYVNPFNNFPYGDSTNPFFLG